MSKISNPFVLILISLLLYLVITTISILIVDVENSIGEAFIDHLLTVFLLLILVILLKDSTVKLFSSFKKPKSIPFLIFATLISSTLIIVVNFYIFLPINEIILPDIPYFSYSDFSPNFQSISDYILVFVSLCIVTPILEEIYFRGFCYSILRARYARLSSVLGVIFVFIIFHPSPDMILLSIFLNYILCIIYELSGSIVYSILIHSFYNISVFFMLII